MFRRYLSVLSVGFVVAIAPYIAFIPASAAIERKEANSLLENRRNVVDQDVILQGGDTIEDAFQILGLPFVDAGTTCGYTNNYDANCPHLGSTAPDVVYSYTGTLDLYVNISLCTGSNYDTKLYVFENGYSDPAYACNDNECASPYEPILSAVYGVRLHAGNTYYFVVDGTGTECGNYGIDIWVVPPVQSCADFENILYGQEPDRPDGNWNFKLSDIDVNYPLNYTVYDNYNFVAGSIQEVHWWGLDLALPPYSECDEDPAAFDIKFYNDAAGAPDWMNPVYSYMVSAQSVATGRLFAVFYEEKEWSASLSPPCPMTNGWISIKGHDSPCIFLWEKSPDGDTLGYQQTGTATPVNVSFSFAMCLGGQVCADVSMTPDQYPIEVSPGGQFGLTGYINNPTSDPITTDVWIMLDVPSYGSYGPLRTFLGIPLNPGETKSAHINQHVPMYAPLGEYEYIAYCDDYPFGICDSAKFQFTVVPPLGSPQPMPGEGISGNWVLEGGWEGNEAPAESPADFILLDAYPNPFNATTSITYAVPVETAVNLSVYNMMGQKVVTLVDGTVGAGVHEATWDAADNASGIYFYKLTAGNQVFTKRMTLLK